MIRILVLAAFLLSMLSTPAAAQSETIGPYVILGATAGKANNPRGRPEYKADLGLELGGQIGLGYAYRALRLEAQAGYEAFFLDSLNPASGGSLYNVDGYGKVSGPVAMLNLFFRPGEPDSMNPFVGAGIGFANLNTKFKGDFCSVPLSACFSNERIASGNETVQAWQWVIGMSKMSRYKNSELFIGYRYFTTKDFSTNLAGYGPVTQDGVESHSLMLAMRWYFGANGD
uniref:Surface antigen msp4 family protein n=1 Tax=uncultured miscellaneous Crenarchaeota group TaxID=1368239 RepID=W8S011_9ARCH|nr:surface antigen msp4 family protein [uncultured miscellaneous Crenarchaeota group]